jgi:DNA repair protein RecO
METKRDLAVVLRTVQYEERHKIITALTENHGRISLLARNAVHSRRFGSSLENFAAGDWIFIHKPGADLGTLHEANLRRGFSEISKDFERMALAAFFSEVMARVALPGEPCPELFRLHSNALALLDEGLDLQSLAFLGNVFLGKLLIWCGNQPQLDSCLSCGKQAQVLEKTVEVTGNIEVAGWVCSTCHAPQSGEWVFELQSVTRLWEALAEPVKAVKRREGVDLSLDRKVFSWLLRVLAFHVPGFDTLSLKSLRFLQVDNQSI